MNTDLLFVCICVRLELEHRLSELEQQRVLKEATGSAKTDVFEDCLRAAQHGEEVASKERQYIKYKIFSVYILILYLLIIQT